MMETETDNVLLIGLDIAWWGGSRSNRSSQYDCLAVLRFGQANRQWSFDLQRIALVDRDPQSTQVAEAIKRLVEDAGEGARVIVAMDAPLQAVARPHLPNRSPLPAKGSVERRRCEVRLSEDRKAIDREDGGSRGWQPNIQPGAPLAPRVVNLVESLETIGFVCWSPELHDNQRMIVECFPAEAIWAIHCFGAYPDEARVQEAKGYKGLGRVTLESQQIQKLVNVYLPPFRNSSGNPALWDQVVEDSINLLLKDETWKTDGRYRGGKLFDDFIDSMICLACALSFENNQAHVWFDPDHPDDGHIIGPGLDVADRRWVPAKN